MDFENLPTKQLENGQVLVEVEPNVWVDYETYKPKSVTADTAVLGGGSNE